MLTKVPTGPVDFAIVTALPIEWAAVLSRITQPTRFAEPDNPYIYFHGFIPVSDGSKYTVVVTQLAEMGNLQAAAATTALLQRWKPRCVLMVGIAAGVANNGVGVGDVAVGTYVHYYEPGKRRVEGEERRPRFFHVDRVLYARASDYRAADWQKNIKAEPPGQPQILVPRAHFGPIASGEKVLADGDTIRGLLKEVPKLIAVEMEGAGVAQAAENSQCRFLEVRGISDLGGADKQDDWQSYAAEAAAAFTVGFLKSKPVRPLAEIDLRQEPDRCPPLLIMRGQAQRSIRPDEILSALGNEAQTRDIENVAIDLTGYVDLGGSLLDPQKVLNRLLLPGGEVTALLSKRDEGEFAFHGHLHIPLAVVLGFLFTDRQHVRFFDFHPTSEPPSWKWPAGNDAPYPELRLAGHFPAASLPPSGDVVLRVAVTYRITSESTRAVIPQPGLELDLQLPEPQRGIIKSERQILSYGLVFRHVLDSLAGCIAQPNQRVHLFYAGPVSLAFHLGQLISASIHPPVVVWNYSRGYQWGIDLGSAARGEARIEGELAVTHGA